MRGRRNRIPKGRLTSIAIIALLIGAGIIAAYDSVAGIASGCVTVKHIEHCLSTSPWQYALFLATMCVGSLGSFGLAALLIYLEMTSDD